MRENHLSPLQGVIITLIVGVSLFLLAVAGILTNFHLSNRDVIYPGVNAGWLDLSGSTVDEASVLLEREYRYPQDGTILLKDGDKYWKVTPSQVGLFLNDELIAQTAFNHGRTGSPFNRFMAIFRAWYGGITFPVSMRFDERIANQYLKAVAAQIDKPTVEASLRVDGTDVIVLPGQIGRTLDIATTIEMLKGSMPSLIDTEINLVVNETAPVILDVSVEAEVAEEIISKPLILKLPDAKEGDPGWWKFEREELARMLVIERVTTPDVETYQVELSSQLLRSFLESVAPDFTIQPENARFIFNDDTLELDVLEPSITGQYLDVDASLQLIEDRIVNGDHKIALDLEYTLPGATSESTAERLGITELVSSHTSYFYGSSSSRKQNIATASSRFHGLLVPPGESFSMADVLGDVSLDTGYAEAWIIFGDRTIKGVGGGVCQVSTTLFRTVFFGGFPILERHPHAYRVTYYEQTSSGGINTNLAGLDATVYVPLVDFKFTNDTDHWLLMETYVGANSLTWKFYSTSDGRTVEWESSGLTNIQEPPDPLYTENPDLDKGEVKQVDWEVKGADVTVSRYVHRDGEIIDSDIIKTHYIPWQAVYEYGPGTKNMPPEKEKD